MVQTMGFSEWYNLDLPAPRMKDADDRRIMAKFTAALNEKFTDFYTYAGGDSTKLVDADGDTMVQVEESSDEDIIRFDTAGGERMVIDNTGDLYMTAGEKICFDGSTKEHYIVYNSTDDNTEIYEDGAIRITL